MSFDDGDDKDNDAVANNRDDDCFYLALGLLQLTASIPTVPNYLNMNSKIAE